LVLTTGSFGFSSQASSQLSTFSVVDGNKRPLRADAIELCTVTAAPDRPTIWALGDSHAGHLQGLLLTLHERTGLGVHLIETPGVPFPMHPDAVFALRKEIYQQIRQRFKPGDIVLVARLFLNRDSEASVMAISRDGRKNLSS
jgi:hypothetical protein